MFIVKQYCDTLGLAKIVKMQILVDCHQLFHFLCSFLPIMITYARMNIDFCLFMNVCYLHLKSTLSLLLLSNIVLIQLENSMSNSLMINFC